MSSNVGSRNGATPEHANAAAPPEGDAQAHERQGEDRAGVEGGLRERPLGSGESAEKPMDGVRARSLSIEERSAECFNSAEIGALAHLYRGEVYRSTIWRTRLDATTNWSVVSLGIALSICYSSANASSLPLLLVGALITVFLYLEARRYRYFNVWRARARWIEINFYAPLLMRQSYEDEGRWQRRLAEDYQRPEHHISFMRAFGRRLRRNYLWIFAVQGSAYFGKVMIHPRPASTLTEFMHRMVVGPVPGGFMLALGLVFYSALAGVTLYVYVSDRRRIHKRPNPISMG